MKKIFVLAAMAAAVMLTSCGTMKSVATTSSASSNPRKSIATGAEGKVQEWESEGYKIDGTRTMYDKLTLHYAKLDENENLVEVEGTGIGSEKSEARLYALNDAAIMYATAAKSVVEGGITRQFGNITESGVKLMGAYTQKVQSAIVPYLKESVAVFRNTTINGKSAVDYDIYFIVDEANASRVRKEAMDQALKDTATEQTFGSAVDQWVKEFVRPMEQ